MRIIFLKSTTVDLVNWDIDDSIYEKTFYKNTILEAIKVNKDSNNFSSIELPDGKMIVEIRNDCFKIVDDET